MAGHSGLPRPVVSAGQGCEERVHVGLRRRMPQGEALRTARRLLIQAHGEEDVGRARNTRGARRAGGRFDASEIQEEQQGVALAAGEGEMGAAGQPPCTLRPSQHRCRNRLANPRDEPVAEP